ncbi:unnamed protein product [Ambrosiozyma monospora]|uniref:Unnamed protein product n=1 Tax=Ambrosiozyma monospora TaxID=43982 RepID=A0ACB5U9M5_AMBMO|nr:unnamed protein product [Ambrosiozyma monospora]
MPFDQFTARYYPDSNDFILTRTKKVEASYTRDAQKILEKLSYSLVDDVIADFIEPDTTTTTATTSTKSKSKSNSNVKPKVKAKSKSKAAVAPSSPTRRTRSMIVESSSSDSENIFILDPSFEEAADDLDVGGLDDYEASEFVSPESLDLDESSGIGSGDDDGFASRRTRTGSGSSSKSSFKAKSGSN